MISNLKDLVRNTHGLGVVELVRINGTDEATSFDTVAEDRSVVIQGKFKQTIPEFSGTFGMPNLGKLNVILGIPEYKENAKVTLQRQGEENTPSGLEFTNQKGDFQNTYRFMSQALVSEKFKTLKMREQMWEVSFTPSQASVQKLSFMTRANAEEKNFTAAVVEGKGLEFSFGDRSSHAGKFVFESNLNGATLSKPRGWPVSIVNAILALPGEKNLSINATAMQITVDSGLATYNFIVPAVK